MMHAPSTCTVDTSLCTHHEQRTTPRAVALVPRLSPANAATRHRFIWALKLTAPRGGNCNLLSTHSSKARHDPLRVSLSGKRGPHSVCARSVL